MAEPSWQSKINSKCLDAKLPEAVARTQDRQFTAAAAAGIERVIQTRVHRSSCSPTGRANVRGSQPGNTEADQNAAYGLRLTAGGENQYTNFNIYVLSTPTVV